MKKTERRPFTVTSSLSLSWSSLKFVVSLLLCFFRLPLSFFSLSGHRYIFFAVSSLLVRLEAS